MTQMKKRLKFRLLIWRAHSGMLTYHMSSIKPRSYSQVASQAKNLKSRSTSSPQTSWKNLSHSLREMSLNR